MPIRNVINRPLVSELKSGFLKGKLVDGNNSWPPGQLPTTFLVSLFDEATKAIINGVSEQSILNTAGGTIATDGSWTYDIAPANSPIIGTGHREGHIAFFEWTWDNGNKAGDYEILFFVVNREKTT